MTPEALKTRLHEVCAEPLPNPAAGQSAERHRRLVEIGREDLSLARLAEAHFDAVSILAEAEHQAQPRKLYGVWAAEIPSQPLTCVECSEGWLISGRKVFASGAGIIDHALVTVDAPEPWLMDVDLRSQSSSLTVDSGAWQTPAFAETNTATVTFDNTRVTPDEVLGERGWYLRRPGFWHGACGPAACWAGGAIGLVDYAQRKKRADPHTLAHLGAMAAAGWAMRSCLTQAGHEMDQAPSAVDAAHIRALECRHIIDHLCSEISSRFGRAYGPHPLAFEADIGKRCQELTLYLRQCHAERDLESIGKQIASASH